MHRSQIWEQPEKEPISGLLLSVFKFLTLGTDSFNKTCYLTLQLAYTGCQAKENSTSKEVKSSRNNLTAAIPAPWSFTPFAEVLLLIKQIKHRNPGDQLLSKPKSCSSIALNITCFTATRKCLVSGLQMDFVCTRVLHRSSQDSGQLLASCSTQAGAVCTTSSPHCSMDGKHLEACSMGIKDFYTPRMGGGGKSSFSMMT